MTETMEQVFDAAMVDARKRWTEQPWTSVGSMIDTVMKERVRAYLDSAECKEKLEVLALQGLLEGENMPAQVKKNLFDSSWDRDYYFKAVIKAAIEKNTDAIDKMMADLVATNGEKIVTEMFKNFLSQAAAKAAGSFVSEILGAAGQQTMLAIQNAGHTTRY